MQKILALGPRTGGTNAHNAALQAQKVLGEKLIISFVPTHEEIFDRILAEDCLAIVPIENNSTGKIEETNKVFRPLFKKGKVAIIGGLSLPISYGLYKRVKTKNASKIKRVFSHEEAFRQCTKTLSEFNFKKVIVESTGEAAEKAIADASAAVLCSSFTADHYGLHLVKDCLEDSPSNATRFLILKRKKAAHPRITAILGINGKYGKYYEKILREKGGSIIGSDIGTALSNIEAARIADVVIVSVDLFQAENVISEIAPVLRKGQVLIYNATIQLLRDDVLQNIKAEIVEAHPMSAPPKKGTLEGQTVNVSLSKKSLSATAKEVLQIFGGEINMTDSKTHDRYGAFDQNLPHAFDLTLPHVMLRLGLNPKEAMKFAGLPYLLRLSSMSRIYSQNSPMLYAGLQFKNSFGIETLETAKEELEWQIKLLKDGSVDDWLRYLETGKEILGPEVIQEGAEFFEEILFLQKSLSKQRTLKVETRGSDPGILSKITALFAKEGVSLTIAVGRENGNGGAIFRFGFNEKKDSKVIQKIRRLLSRMKEVESVK